MNTPSSRQGNLTRYIVYLVLYLIVIGVKKLALLNDHVNKIGYFFFLLCALFTLYFYIRQFNREQRFFEKKPTMPLLADYGFIVGVSILVILGRVFVSYLQAKGSVPLMSFQIIYQKAECNLLFWFLIFSTGLLLPAMQVYLDNKEEYKDCILFYRLGDFYEMFFDDAITVSRELELTLTGKDCGQEERAPMCGVPYHAAETYIAKLIEKGYMR